MWNIENPDGSFSPNYRDVFPEVDATQIPNCAEGGVIPTLAGIIGCMQANEVIKHITKTGELLSGKILILDAQTLQSRIIKIGNITKTQIKSLPTTGNVPVISMVEFKKGLTENIFELIDVRSDRERDEFDIGGKHIPLVELEENIDYFAGDGMKVLYCATGKRSGEGAKIIRNKFPNALVFSLEGGLKAWSEHDF